jgi:hypothetical protein
MSKALWLLALALATGLIAVGCDGDDDNETEEALSKDQWITQADQICERDNQELAQAGANIQNQKDAEQFVSDTLVPKLNEEIEDLRALPAPEGDEDQINAILDAAQRGADEIEVDPTVVSNEASNPFDEANRLANDYGLQVCGQG